MFFRFGTTLTFSKVGSGNFQKLDSGLGKLVTEPAAHCFPHFPLFHTLVLNKPYKQTTNQRTAICKLHTNIQKLLLF